MRTILSILLLFNVAIAQQPIFTSGHDGYRSFRIPAIIKAGNGDLLAFCEGRVDGINDFGNIQIVMKRSADQGKTWSNLQIVASNDTLQAGNSAPVLDATDPEYPKGRVFLFYCTGNRSESDVRKGLGQREIWYKTSTDNGATWSEAANITSQVKEKDWRTYANTPGHAVQFPDGPYKGRIYVAANHSVGDPQPHFADFKAHGYYTDDHGKTFHFSEDVPLKGGNECMAAQAGGQLILSIRNQQGHPRARAIAMSHDGGQTWDTTYIDNRLPDPICQGSILAIGKSPKMPSAKNARTTIGRSKGSAIGKNPIIVLCNPADTAARDNLTIRLSLDGAHTWARTIPVDSWRAAHHASPETPIPTKEKEFTAYSDIVDLGHHRIGVFYERDNYKEIAFKVVKW